MNKQTETLKMAKDMLLALNGHKIATSDGHIVIDTSKEIKACKEALEQPLTRDWKETINERIAKDDEFKKALEHPMINGLTEAETNETMSVKGLSEQPAQEPVAWKCIDDDGEVVFSHLEWCDKCQPLYTHPAPSWQGLSDDEIQEELKKMWDKGLIPSYSIVAFARAIEQALKEKNHASNT